MNKKPTYKEMKTWGSHSFVGRDTWRNIPPCLGHDFERNDDDIVVVLRPILFFYKGQEITYGKINKYFTHEAIRVMEHDDFIEIKK